MLRGRLSREIKDVQGSGRILHRTLSQEVKALEDDSRSPQGNLIAQIELAEESAEKNTV